ncbi:MAG: cation-translocating P-type ATPase [Actinobacteria bacterium]|nr:cation-translocating P-type ATPase [Actinomycetota bacterium]
MKGTIIKKSTSKIKPGEPKNLDSSGNEIFWHTKDIKETADTLNTDLHEGLSDEEADKRTGIYGFNELEEKKGRTPLRIFLSQFNDFMIWILIAAAFISGIIIREITDALVILAILVINSVLGFVQEFRAEKALQALKELASPAALVIRGGREKNVSSKLLVPGDIIKLVAGDLVPADCRVVSQVNLQANESIITGESLPVVKSSEVINKTKLATGDKINLLFSGTTIVKGRCSAVVVGTGQYTEIGKIASMVQESEELTPLQIELKTVGKKIGIICLVISAIVFASGILKGNSVAQMLLVAVALAVAAIPEGLPAIVTVSLALGVQQMAKNNAIVRRLSSVETLGSVSVICTDKTGTLTQNKMMVRKIYTGLNELKKYDDYIGSLSKKGSLSGEGKAQLLITREMDSNNALNLLLKNAVLCNDAYYINRDEDRITGDPTEAALIELGSYYNIEKKSLDSQFPREMEEPFDSTRKMMTTINRVNLQEEGANGGMGRRYILFSKGAPEVITERCTQIMENGKPREITAADREMINKNNTSLAGKAMRNLAFACKFLEELPAENSVSGEEKNLVYLGMVGMIDPPRPEVYDAIKKTRQANIRVIMVTGDHKITAAAIGSELGLLGPDDKIIDGIELDHMTPEELEREIENISIFARVSPSNKVDIVDALKKNQHIVAMTGDGINDAPSLKKADIGVAMGITGTDVSKEASDMILTDDNFATIVKAIRQGRVIYDNLKKFILFLLSCNISEVLLMFLAITAGDYIFYLLTGIRGFFYIPLLPVQILWMNLITDGLPAMALGVDPPERDIMNRKATRKKELILSRRRLAMVSWQGFILTLGSLFVYFASPVFFKSNPEVFQTSVFTTLVITQLLHTYNFRFEEKGIFRKNIFENKYLNLAIFVSIILQVGIIYIPWLQGIFGTTSLRLYNWLLIIICSVASVLIINLINEIRYRLKNNSTGRN